MDEKPNCPVVIPYPRYFWHDAFGCHWCGRETESMVSGHDGMCPVPVVSLLEAKNGKLQRLVIYAGGILAHGTPGSAWMDWIMRAQRVLGMRFHKERFAEDGNGIPFSELENRVKDIPRITIARLKRDAISECGR